MNSEYIKKDKVVVTLIRNKKIPDDYYYIRLDDREEKAVFWIKRLINQFDYDVELGVHIVFEKESDKLHFRPAKEEAEKFIDYLKTKIASECKEEYFVNNWYQFKDITNINNWKKSFYEFINNNQNYSKSSKKNVQVSLF